MIHHKPKFFEHYLLQETTHNDSLCPFEADFSVILLYNFIFNAPHTQRETAFSMRSERITPYTQASISLVCLTRTLSHTPANPHLPKHIHTHNQWYQANLLWCSPSVSTEGGKLPSWVFTTIYSAVTLAYWALIHSHTYIHAHTHKHSAACASWPPLHILHTRTHHYTKCII